jgi:hypothetical protein
MRERRAMGAAEIRDAVLASRPICWKGRPLTAKKVTEVLRYQTTTGRVDRLSTDSWIAPPDRLSRTSRWRYEHWERDWDSGRLDWMERPPNYPWRMR